jgi:hypothetical protein
MRRLHKPFRIDGMLDKLHDQREHLAIQISLLNEAEVADPERGAALTRDLAAIELGIKHHRRTDP